MDCRHVYSDSDSRDRLAAPPPHTRRHSERCVLLPYRPQCWRCHLTRRLIDLVSGRCAAPRLASNPASARGRLHGLVARFTLRRFCRQWPAPNHTHRGGGGCFSWFFSSHSPWRKLERSGRDYSSERHKRVRNLGLVRDARLRWRSKADHRFWTETRTLLLSRIPPRRRGHPIQPCAVG